MKKIRLICYFNLLFNLSSFAWSSECIDKLKGKWLPIIREGAPQHFSFGNDTIPGFDAFANVPIQHGTLGCAMKFIQCTKLPDGRLSAKLSGDFASITSSVELELVNDRRLIIKSMGCHSRFGGFNGANFYMYR